MTTVVLAATESPSPPLNGFSVALSQAAKHDARVARHLTRMSSALTDLYVSTGVSQSASIIQLMAGELASDIQEWPSLTDDMPEIEREVVVLPPPNRRRLVTVHARYKGKARLPVDYDTAQTSIHLEPDVMAPLQACAARGDERAFISAYQAIDWQTRSPGDHVMAINLALTAGAHLAARNLALQAAKLFPSHPEIQKYARVLAPPTVTKSSLPIDPSVRANRDWLSKYGDSYRGRWVGLRNGQLLGSASSLEALAEKIGDTNGVLLTKVF